MVVLQYNYCSTLFLVFIVDTGKKCFVWIGNGASADEKQNAMAYASVRIAKPTLP